MILSTQYSAKNKLNLIVENLFSYEIYSIERAFSEFCFYFYSGLQVAMNLVFINLEKYGPIHSACNAQGQRMNFAQTNSSCSVLSTDM